MKAEGSTCAYTHIVDFRGLRETLRRRREELGWTLDKLAEVSGFDRATIHSIENLKREPELKPKLETFEQLATVMGLTLQIEVLRPADEVTENQPPKSEALNVAGLPSSDSAAIALTHICAALDQLSIGIVNLAASARTEADRSLSSTGTEKAAHRPDPS